MALLVANQSGNFNTAATWDTAVSVGTVHAGTNVSVTTAGKDTTSFTAPNLVNSITGVLVYIAIYPAAGRNFTAELYLSGAATGSIATIQQTDMPTSAGWVYFRLATPVVFSSLTANAYKWNIKSTTANSGSMAADNTSTTLIFQITTYDTHSAPTTADQCWVVPFNCAGSAIIVTVDGTTGDIRGSGTNRTVRNTTMGCYVGGSLTNSLAILKWDTAASATLSIDNMVICTDGGEYQMGTVASPYPAAFTATLNLRQGSGGTSLGILQQGSGRIIFQGSSRTYYFTTYSSGTGVAADPMIVSDPVDWNVGDRIALPPVSNNATNYNETEYRFIITKNSSTSYVLSASSGGAEVAFSFSHTNGRVYLLNRNVNVIPTNATQGYFTTDAPVSGNVDIAWTYIKNMGSVSGTPAISSSLYGLSIAISSSGVGTSSYGSVNYCSFEAPVSYGLIVNSSTSQTYTGNMFYGSLVSAGASTASGLGIGTNATGHTFTDTHFFDNNRQILEYRGVNCIFNNLFGSGNNKNGTAANGGIYLAGGAPATFNSPSLHACRIGSVVLAGTTNSAINNGEIGTKGTNASDYYVVVNTANNILSTNTNVGSSTLVSNYLNGAIGATLIAFHKLNNITNNHKWYTEYGSAQSTGVGLPDTTIRTSGTLNVRIAPENSSTGFKYEYKVLAKPGSAVQSFIFIEKNATFNTDVATVELFLPGSTVADSSTTVSNVTGSYNVYAVAANYLGTENLYATVRVTAKSVAAGAYLYLADVSNGTNNIINFNTWDRGQPSPIMFEQLGDAGAIWAYLFSGSRTAEQTLEAIYGTIISPEGACKRGGLTI